MPYLAPKAEIADMFRVLVKDILALSSHVHQHVTKGDRYERRFERPI
jgi:hypothetical protein